MYIAKQALAFRLNGQPVTCIEFGHGHINYTMKVTTDTGNKGIAIVAGNGSSGWYSNPDAWTQVLTKPYTWGASVWTFENSGIDVPTAIEEIAVNVATDDIYDLSGRRITNPEKGIYVVNGNKVLIR